MQKHYRSVGSPDLDEPSLLRRSLLMGCAYLPAAPLLSLLAGCEPKGYPVPPETVQSTFEPVPEASITVTVPEPISVPMPPYAAGQVVPDLPVIQQVTGPITVPLTHIPEQLKDAAAPEIDATIHEQFGPSKLVKKDKMKVGVYNFEYNAFTQLSSRKRAPRGAPGSIRVPISESESKTMESLEVFVARAMDNRLALLYRGMIAAFEKHSPKAFDVSFVTAPEFYWNVPWTEFLNEDELAQTKKLLVDRMMSQVQKLMAKFPAEEYGHIILLPGTAAGLEKAKDNPAGTAYYKASNFLYCTHNLPTDDPKSPRPRAMLWPKRHVSSIDIYDSSGERCPNSTIKKTDRTTVAGLHCATSLELDLKIDIEAVMEDSGRSYDDHGKERPLFDNDIIPGLPFGIDICLDYSAASTKDDEKRMAQLDERKFKLDFLISAGMPLDINKYAGAAYIQYVIHNEGIMYHNETSRGGSLNLFSTVWGLDYDNNKKTMTYETVFPLDAEDPYDEKGGVIPVDASTGFKVPEGVDMSGMPEVIGMMNPAQVRIFALDVDTSGRAAATALVAGDTNAPGTPPVHFVQ